ncbi:MAG: aminodeoxychorismate synthase component I [Labilithrix sp.]|nr:aminodeoxychorismate synthase component I [Labilithrix sp.]
MSRTRTAAREAFHLVRELDHVVTPETFRAAFPERAASSFVLAGGAAAPSARLDRVAYFGAAPSATFRARRVADRDALGRRLTTVDVDRAGDERDPGDERSPGDEHGPGARETLAAVDPFAALADFLADNALPETAFDARYPFPFRGGLVGYVGYECGQALEALPGEARPSTPMPDMAFALHRWILATGRAPERSWLSVIGVGASRDDARDDAEARCARVLRRLDEGASRPQHAPPHAATPDGVAAPHASAGAAGPHGSPDAGRDRLASASRINATLSAAEYVERVARAKRHIEAGDAFEICLTNALGAPLARRHAWTLFDELRRSNPAPFAALLDLPEGAVVSSSPERFLSLDARGIAESRPIKGTRPRGATPAEDARLARELAASEKDRAENAMIVDLVRNDLGRVCRFGTVEAPEVFAVEPYATVHQLVSTVRGELDAGTGAIDLLRACFPPGSMTGAPKIEAMRILEQLEPVERGVYSGALGWIDLGGAMDLSVVIRTVVLDDAGARFSVGGAIVADSDPHDEHEETEHKAFALVRALAAISATEPPA